MTDLRELLRDVPPIEVGELDEGDIITDAIILLRVQSLEDTEDFLVIGVSENTGGIVTHGILTSAVLQHTKWMTLGSEGQ